MYDDFTVESKSEEKWLGDMLSNQGLGKSVELTVDQRYGSVGGFASTNDWWN